MNKSISILGCGWLGKDLAFYLKEKGYLVKGSNTTAKNFNEFKERGVKSYIVDIERRHPYWADFLTSDILIVAITSKDRVAFKRLLLEIERCSVQKVIFISSTSVYERKTGVFTEDSAVNTNALSQIEQLFQNSSSVISTIVRFGGLWGDRRMPVNFISKTEKMRNPKGCVNLIHKDDCIHIIEEIIKKEVWGEILNACCPSHPTREEFYTLQAKKHGRNLPVFETEGEEIVRIISSEKLVRVLNYEFRHSDVLAI